MYFVRFGFQALARFGGADRNRDDEPVRVSSAHVPQARRPTSGRPRTDLEMAA
jgi:hypothetical protein